jgi:hypothetical protein
MRRLIALALVGGLAVFAAPLAASADSWRPAGVHAGVVLFPPPIPVPRVEVVAGYGGPATVWVPGHWAWRGGPHGYHWVGGAWFRPPYPGAVWVAPHWAWGHGGHRWVHGHWGHHGHRGHHGQWGHHGHRGHVSHGHRGHR